VNVYGQQSVGLQGSLPVQPLIDTTYPLTLQWGPTLGFSVRATTTVQVTVPQDPTDSSRNLVTISSEQMVPMFVRALGTPNTTVNVTADLDLTGLPYYPTTEFKILIADGVHLMGGRIAVPGQPFQPGPRLFVTDCPQYLFNIIGNNVKVSGVRIEGPSMWPDSSDCIGISIGDVNPYNTAPPPSGANVEIDHNEFSGWSDTALGVGDTAQRIVVPMTLDYGVTPAEVVYYANPTREPVWIHDNFFHNNLHSGTAGYGVGVGNGAHALIERNVFDYNRHAITSGYKDGRVGYRAYRNLVLQNGTGDQQFDMHGSQDCYPYLPSFIQPDNWCGLAGHDFDIGQVPTLLDNRSSDTLDSEHSHSKRGIAR
jgi:hypothetical protein